jgi:AcrR family transcriptional regulator
VGRRAGVSAKETRAGLLQAAALVFSSRGYEGATMAEIAAAAGLSTGSIYAHYRGKAQLFLAVLEHHGRGELTRHLNEGSPLDMADFLLQAGSNLDDRRPIAQRTLMIEAIMAAKHDPEVRTALSSWFTDRHRFMTKSIRAAQEAGQMRPDVDPDAIARLATAVGLGTLLLDVVDVPRPSRNGWAALIRDVVTNLQTES